MEGIWQAAAFAVTAALTALVVRKGSGEFALLVSLAACCLLLSLCAGYLKTVFSYLDQLRQTAGLETAVTAPLLKAVGIGLVTKIAASICSQAGENALAGFVELCGTILAVFACLPLLQAVLELLEKLICGIY